ncbi:Inclusion body protein [Bordetella sputigena]|uniref:hypothetical protein n=1 Tax=Bordetella sputigena TaxID=1416810 RepID=UPI0039F11A8E
MDSKATGQNSKVNPLAVTGKGYGPDNPQTVIRILVDTAYVASVAPASNGVVSNGVYMMDNRGANGSSGEGGYELHTVARLEDFIAWTIGPVDSTTQDTVKIIGFEVLGGSDVFTSAGEPRMRDTAGQLFVGQILNASSCTYRIKALLTVNGLSQENVPFFWDPSIAVD